MVRNQAPLAGSRVPPGHRSSGPPLQTAQIRQTVAQLPPRNGCLRHMNKKRDLGHDQWAQYRSNFVQHLSTLVTALHNFGHTWSNSVQLQPMSAHMLSTSLRVRSCLARARPTSTTVGPSSAKLRPKSTMVVHKLPQIWPDCGGLRSGTSVDKHRSGPNPAEFGQSLG